MNELDRRLARGPLQVRSVWTPEPPERLARALLARRRRAFALRALSVGSALACALFVFWPRHEPTRTEAHAPMAAPLERRFADGSHARLASRETRLDVELETPKKVTTRLRGAARFEVEPQRERAFEVHTAALRVRVLGTVSIDERRGSIAVEKGMVEITWRGGSAQLGAGQSGVYPPAPPLDLPAVETAASPTAAAEPAAASPIAARPARKTQAPSAPRDVVAELLQAADRARLEGHPEQAVAPLRTLSERHAQDRRAPVAAFALARVLLDDLSRPADAALAFQRVRTVWPHGPLAESATVREAEAFRRAGDSARASAAARVYLAAHPAGRHASAMRSLLAGQ